MIPCGIVPPNPSEILLSEHLPKLIAELRTKFDYVIIDSAPVGIVSDSLTLGNFADCTVFIVRQRYTHKKQLEYINSLYELKKLPHITLVVNDVKVDGLQSYYGYYSQGKYGYGSYETKK
jgi:tyrosine-protein kinase Etk/Wzc